MITVFAVNAVQGSGEMKMTKFEEDLNKKMDLKEVPMYFTQSGCSLTKKTYIETNWVFDTYKNWHSDEEFHELSEKLDDTNDALVIAQNSRDEFEREYKKLKSQLQQQALPVVKDFVAEWIEILKTKGLKPLKNPETYGETGFTEEKLQNIVFWISEHQEDYMRAWLDGYQVEKPQLFYLKDNLTGMYLYKIMIAYNEGIKGYKWDTPTKKGLGAGNYKFTQSEIDSMHAESYEQIEVEK